MTFERSYMNWEEGIGVCLWDSPSKDKLIELLEKTGVKYDSVVQVEELVAESLVT